MDASIIIPAYNVEKIIGNCVEACMQQNYKGKFEVIVVDDGSTDLTSDAAEELGAIILKQTNSGPAKARNFGAKKAKGEILVFTDADCEPGNNWLEEMLKPFKDKEVVGVQGAYKTRQKSLMANFNQIEIEERYERMKKAKKLDWIGSYSAAYRKNDFFDANGFDESFPIASGEDPELSYKLSKMGKKLVFNPKAVVYHLHPDSVLKYLKVKFFRAFYRVNLYSKHKDKIVNDSYTPNSLKLQIIFFYLANIFGIISLISILLGDLVTGGMAGLISLGFNVLFGGAMAKSVLFVGKRNKTLAVFTPLIISGRSLVFGAGLILGTLKFKLGKASS